MTGLSKLIVGAFLCLSLNYQASPVSANKITGDLKREVSVAHKIIPNDPSKRCPKYEARLKEMGLPVEVFSYIMWRESRCQPKVIGWNYEPGTNYKHCKGVPSSQYKKCSAVRSYDSGLLQINSTWVTVTSDVCNTKWGDMTVLLNANCNLKVAQYLFYKGGGLSNWGFRS